MYVVAKTNSLLFETYYDLWLEGKTHREKDLETLLKKVELAPDVVWIEGQFLSLAMAHRVGDREWLKSTSQKLLSILGEVEIIEHVLLCAQIYPHSYHRSLIEALSSL
jgi:hypothetical protein